MGKFPSMDARKRTYKISMMVIKDKAVLDNKEDIWVPKDIYEQVQNILTKYTRG